MTEQSTLSKSPTAYYFSAAIVAEAKKGVTDPVPTLYHPLVDPVPLPTLETTNAKQPTSSTRASTNTSNQEEAKNGSSTRVRTPSARDQSGGDKQHELPPQTPSKSHNHILKTEPVPKTTQSANGIDALDLEGDGSSPADTCTGFDAGPLIHMNDFSAFDDEVTPFFWWR